MYPRVDHVFGGRVWPSPAPRRSKVTVWRRRSHAVRAKKNVEDTKSNVGMQKNGKARKARRHAEVIPL